MNDYRTLLQRISQTTGISIQNLTKPIHKDVRRKDDFEPYTEPFRPLNDEEIKSLARKDKVKPLPNLYSDFLVSYQAISGGFTICNILVNGRLYSGCSHCIKSDRWLTIRGKMNAFRRASEQSEGVEIPHQSRRSPKND